MISSIKASVTKFDKNEQFSALLAFLGYELTNISSFVYSNYELLTTAAASQCLRWQKLLSMRPSKHIFSSQR